MITRWTFLLFTLLLISSVIPATVFGQEPSRNQSGWRATVECDSVVVYSQMSTQGIVVGRLKKGDVVRIDMEFISAGGTWGSVTEPGKRAKLGYVQSECLEREQPESFTRWEAQSPPTQTRPDTEPAQGANRATENRATREEIEQEVDRAIALRLKELQLANETPVQMVQPEPFGFDDQTSFLFLPRLGFLPRFGVPFNLPFHHITPRITGGVQIRPSRTLRRR